MLVKTALAVLYIDCVFLELNYNSLCKNRFTYKQIFAIYLCYRQFKENFHSFITNKQHRNTMMPTRDTTQTRHTAMHNRLRMAKRYLYVATTTTIVVALKKSLPARLQWHWLPKNFARWQRNGKRSQNVVTLQISTLSRDIYPKNQLAL